MMAKTEHAGVEGALKDREDAIRDLIKAVRGLLETPHNTETIGFAWSAMKRGEGLLP